MIVRPLPPPSKPRLCTLPSPVCVPFCCSSHVASLRTFLKTSGVHYSNKTALLATGLTCTSAHHCAQNVGNILRDNPTVRAPAITTTLQQHPLAAGLHPPPCIAEARACCSISPRTGATRVSLPHHMRLQPTATYHHSFPSNGDDCSPVTATKTASLRVAQSSMCALLLQLPCGQPAHLPQKRSFSLH